MKLGLWLTARFEPPVSATEHFRHLREQVALARDAGFALISSGQHHLGPRLQTLPLLARLAADAGDMEVATSVMLLPLHHPVDVAEESATMNAMLDGRFILGVGLGHDRVEQATYRVRRDERARRFDEAMRVMDLVWEGTGAQVESAYFTIPAHGDRGSIRTRPRLWIGGSSEAALRRAATWDAAWLPSSLAAAEVLERRAQLRALAVSEGRVPASDAPAGLWLHVAESDEAALRLAARVGHVDTADVPRPGIIVGGPDRCLDAIREYRDGAGVSHLLCRLEVPGMQQRDVLRMIEIVGTFILPELVHQPS